MDSKRMDEFIKKALKRNAEPVLEFTMLRFGKGEKPYRSRRCEVFRHWNGEALFFKQFSKKDRHGKVLSIRMPFPAGLRPGNIVSIRVATQLDLINNANCLFGIWEDAEKRKKELAKRR